MKRLISVTLCFWLLVSLSVNAFATDENGLTLNQTETVTLSTDEELVFTFNPKITGKYKITVSGGTKALAEVAISSKNGFSISDTVVTTDVKNYNGYNLQDILKPLSAQLIVYVNAEYDDVISIKIADKTSLIIEEFKEHTVLKGIEKCFTPCTVSITVELTELDEIKPYETILVADEVLLEFTPDKTGEYGFLCNTADGAQSKITIWDKIGIYASEYGKSEYTVFLNAGETYIIKCKNTKKDYDGNTYGSYTVEIQYIHVHSFGEWIYNDDATFFKNGTRTHTCICGELETEISEGTATIAVILNRIYEALLWVVNLFVK